MAEYTNTVRAVAWLVVAVSIIAVAEAPPTNGCPGGWQAAHELGCLRVTGSTNDPFTMCENLDSRARPVKIESFEQNELVYAKCISLGATTCWIGLNDVDTEGVFHWAGYGGVKTDGGAALSDFRTNRDRGYYNTVGFSSWVSGQPRVKDGADDAQADQADYVRIAAYYQTSNKRWVNEKGADASIPAVCQMPATCTEDVQCQPSTPYCNTDNGVCYECKGTDYGREATDIDAGCGPLYPFCNADFGSCKECLLDRHCGAGSVCNKGVCFPIDANGCPEGYTYHAEIGCFGTVGRYDFYNPSAQDCSTNFTAIPVTVSSQSVQNAVYTACLSKLCWIGANDIGDHDNNFRWWTTSTSPPSFDGPTLSAVGYNNFFNFQRPQTGDAAPNERNCVRLSSSSASLTGDAGAWIDERCATNLYPLMCQMAPRVRQDLYISCPVSVVMTATGPLTTLQLFNLNYVQGNSSDTVESFTCETEWGNYTTLAALLELDFEIGLDQLVVCTVTDGSGALDTCEFNVTITPPGCSLLSIDTEPLVADCAAVNNYVVEFLSNATTIGCLNDVDAATLIAELEEFLGTAAGCLSVRVDLDTTPESRRRALLQAGGLQFDLLIGMYTASAAEQAALRALLQSPAFVAFLEQLLGRLTGFPVTLDTAELLSFLLASATSDPHFVTQAGVPFDFMGVAGKTYCVLSSGGLAVNVRMMGVGGALVPDASDARTWMDQLAVVFKGHRVLIGAQSPAGTPFTLAFGTITVDDEPLDQFAKSLARSFPDGLVVSRAKNRVRVIIPGVASVHVEVVRAAWWEGGKGPGANFLNFQVKEFHGSQPVHGVLGQTLAGMQKDATVLDGRAEDYETSSIFATEWRFSKYNN